MRALIAAMALASMAPNPAGAQDLPAGDLPEQHDTGDFCGITADNVGGYRKAMVGEWRPLTSADPIRYEAFANERFRAVLTFTKSRHAAHPAVVCRSVVDAGSGSRITMKVECEASKSACDQLVRDFAALNAQLPGAARRRDAPLN